MLVYVRSVLILAPVLVVLKLFVRSIIIYPYAHVLLAILAMLLYNVHLLLLRKFHKIKLILAILHPVDKMPFVRYNVVKLYANVCLDSSAIHMAKNVDLNVHSVRIVPRIRLVLIINAWILVLESVVMELFVKLLTITPFVAALHLWWVIHLWNVMKHLKRWILAIHHLAVRMVFVVLSMVWLPVHIPNVLSTKIAPEIDPVLTRNVAILVLMLVVLMLFVMPLIIRLFVLVHLATMVQPIVSVCNKWMWYQHLDQNVLRIVIAVMIRLVSISNVRILVNWATFAAKMHAAMYNCIDLYVYAMKVLLVMPLTTAT